MLEDATLNNSKQGDRKAGGLAIFCGIWSLILGCLFGFMFVFSWFDIGGGYAKVGWLYKKIAANINLIVNILGILMLSSCLLLVVGGVTLLLNKRNTSISVIGLCGIYFYFLCFVVMASLLSVSARAPGRSLPWICGCLFLLVPIFFLQRVLNKNRGRS